MPTKTRIQLRRGNLADLPTLLAGEPGFALDTENLYIGNTNGNTAIASFASLCEGRLSFSENQPKNNEDITYADNLYYLPYRGNRISLYINNLWHTFRFSKITFDLQAEPYEANYPYDVFLYYNGNNLSLSIERWNNAESRAVMLSRIDGVYVKSTNSSYRYLGSFYGVQRSGYSGIWGCDNITQRLLYNAENQVPMLGFSCPNYNNNNTTTNYTVAAGTNMASLSPVVEYISANPHGDFVRATANYRIYAGASATAHIGIGLEGNNVRASTVIGASTTESGSLFVPFLSPLGYHSLRLKVGAVTAAATITADDGRFGSAADVPVTYLTFEMLA